MRRYTDDPLVWMLVGGLGFGLFLGIGHASGPGWLLIWLLGGALVSLVAYSFYLDPQPKTTTTVVSARPPTIRLHVRSRFGRAPWIPGFEEPNELVYWRRLQPNLLIAIVLAALGVVPAVIYVVLAMRSTQTITVITTPESDRTSVTVTIRPRSHDGRRISDEFVVNLARIDQATNHD